LTELYQNLTDNGRINGTVIDREIREGTAAIAEATTTDGFPPTFTEVLHPVVQLHAVTRRTGARPLLLATFAIPATELAHYRPPAAGGRTVYSIHFRLSAVGPDGEWVEVDTTRHFAVPRPLGEGQYLRGTLELPVSPGSHRTALRIDQADGRGAVAGLSPVAIPAAGGGLAISSLVLGSAGAGFEWRSDTRAVPLNTLNAFEEKSEVSLYYQLLDATPGREYQVNVEFFEVGADDDAEPLLRVTFRERAGARFTEVERSVALHELKAGRYRLVVTVADDDGTTARTESRLTVVKR
jgi:hypothetical protein